MTAARPDRTSDVRPTSGPRGFRPTSRRRSRIAAGVALAAIAVGGNLWVYSNLDAAEPVVQAARDIPAGEQITADMLRIVDVEADSTVNLIAADRAESLVGTYAKVRLVAGSLFTAEALQTAPLVAPGTSVVAIQVADGSLPIGLRERVPVQLVVSTDQAGANGVTTSVTGRVVGLPTDTTSALGMQSLSVEVAASDAAVVAAADDVRVVLLQPAEDPATAIDPATRRGRAVTVVAVVGDAATTTSVAVAAGWPAAGDVLVLEADPRGGSLAGWLDVPAHPSLATVVATSGTSAVADHESILGTFAAMTRRSDSGLLFVANAVRSRAAHRAVEEAAVAVLPAIAAAPTIAIADAGVHAAGRTPSPALRVADVVVIVHRQATASARAATVRIERLVESVEELAHLDAVFVLAVIGRAPFDPLEIGLFVEESVPGTVRTTVTLADDPLAAATIAGRAGVSAKRLRRLPLMRDASALAVELAALVADGHRHLETGTRREEQPSA